MSKVFVSGLLAPSLGMSGTMSHPGTPVEGISTPAKATGRHMKCLDEVRVHPWWAGVSGKVNEYQTCVGIRAN